jgi:hypothetical protein
MGAGQLVAAPLRPADVWGHWQHTDMQHLAFKTELLFGAPAYLLNVFFL